MPRATVPSFITSGDTTCSHEYDILENNMERILIAGAGALGSYLGERLHNAHFDLHVLARGRRLDSIRRDGIVLETANGVSIAKVRASRDCARLEHADLVLLCTKAPDIEAVLELVSPCIGPDTLLVTLQNGVETPTKVAIRFPSIPVLPARVHGFFEMVGDRVRHVGVEPSLAFGAIFATEHGSARQFAAVLSRAGIAGRLSPNIMVDLWEKLMLTSAFGGVGAATGLAAGPMRANAATWALLDCAMQEVEALALSRGVRLSSGCVERTLRFVAEFPTDATASMKRDLESGRNSEYVSLTGGVIRMAADAEVNVPAHHQIEQMIRARGLLSRS